MKRFCILGISALMLLPFLANETWGQGFGGFHGRRGVYVGRGVGYGGIVGYPRRVGYGYNYGNVGNPYGAYGGVTTVGGVRVGAPAPVRPTAANLALADMALSNRNDRPAPTGPAPGPGPRGIESMVDTSNTETPDSRSAARDALRKSLNQTQLPSDAGLPAGKAK